MAGPLDSLKALWRDPKKKPIVIAGVAVAGTAGVLAMRRPVDEGEAAAEDQIAETGAGPADGDPYNGLGEDGSGFLPPVLVAGGGYGGGDDGMGETDFSAIYGELDNLGAQLNQDLSDRLAKEREARRRASQRQKKRDAAQEKRLNNQRRKIAALRKRARQRSKPKGKPGNKRQQRRRAARARGGRATKKSRHD